MTTYEKIEKRLNYAKKEYDEAKKELEEWEKGKYKGVKLNELEDELTAGKFNEAVKKRLEERRSRLIDERKELNELIKSTKATKDSWDKLYREQISNEQMLEHKKIELDFSEEYLKMMDENMSKDSKQKDGLRFRNHRPVNASDIPIQFYHQIFEEFINLVQDCQVSKREHELVLELASVMSRVFSDEDERADAFRRWLELFFDNKMDIRKEVSNIAYSSSQVDQRITDGSIYPKIGKDRVLLANIEVKPEPGMNGSCYIQNDAYYKEFVIKSRKQKSMFYYMTCLPAFLINLEGPNVSISGAVSVPFIVSDHLTDIFPLDTITYNHTKADDVARKFMALKNCLCILKEYYNAVYELKMDLSKTISDSGCWFPCINKVNIEEGTVIIKYKERYSLNRNLWIVEIKFKDKKTKGLVKFVQKYSEEAHRKCFELGLAPKLWAVNNLQLGWKIIIMEYLEEYKTLFALDSRIFPQTENAVRNAIKLIHDSNYVHGDFRDENIIVKYKNEKIDIKIVDFDCAGREGKAKYPESLNPNINWHLDAGLHKFIKKEHDIHLVDYLYHNITYDKLSKK